METLKQDLADAKAEMLLAEKSLKEATDWYQSRVATVIELTEKIIEESTF